MADGLRLALTTLTVLPVRGPAQVDRSAARTAMVLAPVVGLLLGGLAAGVLLAAQTLTGSPLLAAALAVAALAVLTRGLHLDGLADTVDGLASYRPPEQAREVMKAPDLGPLGMAAVVLSLLVQVAALAACAAHDRGALAVVLAAVTGRLAVTAACTPATAAATQTGLGALVAGTVPRAVPPALAVVVALVAGLSGRLTGAGAVLPVVAVAGALLLAHVLRRHAVRRFGGLTGDVLGALVEVGTVVILVAMAVDVR